MLTALILAHLSVANASDDACTETRSALAAAADTLEGAHDSGVTHNSYALHAADAADDARLSVAGAEAASTTTVADDELDDAAYWLSVATGYTLDAYDHESELLATYESEYDACMATAIFYPELCAALELSAIVRQTGYLVQLDAALVQLDYADEQLDACRTDLMSTGGSTTTGGRYRW